MKTIQDRVRRVVSVAHKCYVAIVLFLISEPSGAANPPRLNPPKVLADGTEIILTGSAGVEYDLETSADLKSWSSLSRSSAQDGRLTFKHREATGAASAFYRARIAETNVAASFQIVPQLDTNFVAAALITTNGGSCVLFTPDSRSIVLTVPPMTVPEPMFVTMTLVTNIDHFPFSRGTLGAVSLQPEGLQFWGAAQLEIEFPPDLEHREIVSFTADGDGAGLHLALDRVQTRSVLMAVAESGIVGATLATEEEVRTVASQSSNSSSATSVASPLPKRSVSLHASISDDCQAEKKRVATAISIEISKAVKIFNDVAMIDLSAARRRALNGSAEDPPAVTDVLSRAFEDMCLLYKNMIEPRWQDAKKNCALGALLSQFTLGFERQQQILGSAANPTSCVSLNGIPFCALGANCLDEVRECCQNGRKGTDFIAEVLGIERQNQILGLGCNITQKMQEATDECSSNAWTGAFNITLKGHKSIKENATTTEDSTELYFTASIVESQERDAGELGIDVDLRVRGKFAARDFHSKLTSYSKLCKVSGNTESLFQLDESEFTARAESEYIVHFATDPVGNYLLTGFHLHSLTNSGVPGNRRSLAILRTTSCFGPSSSKQDTANVPRDSLGPPLIFRGTGAGHDTIQGSTQDSDPTGEPPFDIRFDWNFQRHRKDGGL